MDMKRLGNIKVNITNTAEILSEIKRTIKEQKKSKLFFLNAYCFLLSQQNHEYLVNVNQADYVVNDGIGIEVGAKIFGFRFEENLNGTDLTPKILGVAEEQGFSVFLLGGLPGVAENAAKNFQKQFPFLKIVGCADGYFTDSNQVIDKINRSNPDILIVGLGVPYQENWISTHFSRINARLFMGVGAFLDFSSNRVKRAPYLLRKARMEWVYRLIHEPRRLWKRSITGTPLIFFYLIRHRLTRR